jgi:hypothetical protein
VVALRLDDSELPIYLQHKLFLNFQGRFDSALATLADDLTGATQGAAPPRQAVLAEMVKNADDELWTRLSHGTSEWTRHDVADVLRGLQTNEVEAAVAIGSKWRGSEYKQWEGDLTGTIKHNVNISEAAARRLLRSLETHGFIESARDLDYRDQPEPAWCEGDLLVIFSRAARRSGLFLNLKPPLPERLSSLLADTRSIEVIGRGWYAFRFARPTATLLDPHEKILVVVSSSGSPTRTWGFRSAEDRSPLQHEGYTILTALCPDGSLAGLSFLEGKEELELVGFNLLTFDDLGLLRM